MNAQKVKRQIKIQEWAAQVTACKQSGQSVKQWCNEQGIKLKTFYNHMRVVREEMLDMVETAKTDPVSGATRLGIGNITTKQYLSNVSNEQYYK